MKNEFAADVIAGLKDYPKHLSSKYFYDARGDKIFQQIMALPEYYLTRCEYSIFKSQKQWIIDKISSSGAENFDLIELGAGDGTKTKILIEHTLKEKVKFTYYPIDISPNVLTELVEDLNKKFPKLPVKGIPSDYFEAFKEINKTNGHRKKVVLFLGSNIGNFDEKTANAFLKKLSSVLAKGDMALIGFDFKKHPKIIRKAYDDDAGITESFNLNLLERINRELDGNFKTNNFMHNAVYNPESGKAESFLISKKKQKVKIQEETIEFEAWETIHMEISQKYDLRMINSLADKADFTIAENYFDENKYYVDSLWVKK